MKRKKVLSILIAAMLVIPELSINIRAEENVEFQSEVNYEDETEDETNLIVDEEDLTEEGLIFEDGTEQLPDDEIQIEDENDFQSDNNVEIIAEEISQEESGKSNKLSPKQIGEKDKYGTVLSSGECGETEADNLIWTYYDKDNSDIYTLVISGKGKMKNIRTVSDQDSWPVYNLLKTGKNKPELFTEQYLN